MLIFSIKKFVNNQANQLIFKLLLLPMVVFFQFPPDLCVAKDPYNILTSHFNAVGGIATLRAIHCRYSEGTIRYDGLQGSFKHWEEKPLRNRTEIDFSVINYTEGDSGEFSWLFDTNGQLLISKDKKTLERRQIQELLENFEHLKQNSPYFTLHHNGMIRKNNMLCHDLLLVNSINSDRTHYYIDTQSYLMVASSYITPDTTTETIYDDFQTVDAILVPFHIKSTYYPVEKEEEIHITRYTINEASPRGIFSAPLSSKDFRFSNSKKSVAIPFELQGNLIYLPVSVGNETRLWLLDSGASMSVIDKNYALNLGLNERGSIKGYGFGKLFSLGFVTIPEYSVGDIHFQKQKIYVTEGITDRSYEPVIHGILGYDFLSRFVIEIDFEQQIATFHDPQFFTYQGNGLLVDAPLKYRTFTLPVKLNGFQTGLWSLDLGSHQSSLHYPFAVKNKLINRAGIEMVSQGISGLSFSRLSQFGCLVIGHHTLENQLISVPHKAGRGATALGEVDGNLGISSLRNFHLYLNYPEQQVILEKGHRFNSRFPRDKSGIIIGISQHNQPMISYMDKSAPAYRAGLRTGDILLTLNGDTIEAGHSVLALRKVFHGATGERIVMQVLRGNEEITASFTLTNLYQDAVFDCKKN